LPIVDPQTNPASPEPSADADGPAPSSRRFGRIRVSGANASLGRILDIPGGGMRILSRSMAPGPRRDATIPIQIDVGDEEWLGLTARVAWVRRVGLLQREIGLEFVEIEDGVKKALRAMAYTSGSAGGFRLLPQAERED